MEIILLCRMPEVKPCSSEEGGAACPAGDRRQESWLLVAVIPGGVTGWLMIIVCS